MTEQITHPDTQATRFDANELTIEQKLDLAYHIYSISYSLTPNDYERVSLLLIDWLISLEAQEPLDSFLAANGAEPSLVHACKKVAEQVFQKLSLANSDEFLLAHQTMQEMWNASRSIEALAHSRQIWKLKKLPPFIQRALNLGKKKKDFRAESKIGASFLIEAAFQLWRKGYDFAVIVPLLLNFDTIENLSKQGLLFFVPAFLAWITNEILMYHSQKKALENRGLSTKVVSTLAHQSLDLTPKQAALAQRFFGKIGWWEYIIWLTAAATQNVQAIITLIVLRESLGLFGSIPDILMNYGLGRVNPLAITNTEATTTYSERTHDHE